MKREILCKRCGERLQLSKYPNEGWKKLFGTLGFRSSLVKSCFCDECNTTILVGQEVCAVSIYVAGGYFPWESEYLSKPGKLETWNGEENPPPNAA